MPIMFLDFLHDLDNNTMFSGASAIAALISALFASSASRAAAKSAAIAEAEFAQKNDGISADLIDGISWEDKEGRITVAFACTLINRAVTPSSISRIELLIHEFEDNGQSSKLKLDPAEPILLKQWSLQAFPKNINIPERGTTSGWVSFQIPSSFSKNKQIDRYELRFITSLGIVASLDQYILRKIEDGANN